MHTIVPIIRRAGEGDRRSFKGGGLHTWKLLNEETDGEFFLFEDQLTAGKNTPLHLHPEAAETTYVLEGEILVSVGGVETRVAVGGVSFVPKGVPHAFLVLSGQARLLTLQTPGVGQSFYRAASDATDAESSDIVDIPRVQAAALEHARGVQLLGPPPFAPTVAVT